MCAGGIHASGSSPASSSFSCRSQSALSVFARRFRPRLPAVSAGLARCARWPARSISSTTKRQPVVPSSANSASQAANCSSHSRTAPRVAGTIRPRLTSPDSRSSVLYVICLRCTSNATTIVIGTSSSSVDMNDTAWVTRLSRGGLTTCHLFDLGGWDELLERAERLIRSDEAYGGSQVGIMALTYRARVLVLRGQTTEAASLRDGF